MSFEYLKAAIKCTRVRGTTKLVLILLADRADNRLGVCWPSVRRVARDAGIAKSTVQEQLKTIQDLGIMRVIMHGDQMRSNRYRLDLEAMAAQSSECGESNGVPTAGTQGVPDAGTPVPNGLHGSVPVAGTEPISVEPIKKLVTSNQSVKEEATKQQIPLAPLAQSVRGEKRKKQAEAPGNDGMEHQQMDECSVPGIWRERDTAGLTSIWQKHTGNLLATDEIELAWTLISEQGLDEVGAALIDTFTCPALRKIAWRDFRVWARNYALNYSKVLAWRRSLGEEKASARAHETTAALALHVEAGEQECLAPIMAAFDIPDDFRCADCKYDAAGQRTTWCTDCYDEMRGEGESACELGISLGNCPECRSMTPDGWEYCKRHGCVQCGKKREPSQSTCGACSDNWQGTREDQY